MPICVRMYLLLQYKLDYIFLDALAEVFKKQFSLTSDDFYAKGPFIFINKDDYCYLPVTDEQYMWIDLNIWRNYYGIGYERGDIEMFIQIAEWIEANIPDCTIYYGNDFADESIILFDKAERDKLIVYFQRNSSSF